MKHVGELTLGPKLFISFVIAVGVSIFFVLFFSYNALQQNLEERFLESLVLTADAKGKHLVSFFDQVERDVRAVTSSDLMGGTLFRNVTAEFREDVVAVTEIDPSGSVVRASQYEDGVVTYDINEATLFKIEEYDWERRLHISDIIIPLEAAEDSINEPFFYVVAPLYEDGVTSGYLFFYFDLKRLHTIFENKSGLDMYLLNKRGEIVKTSLSMDNSLIRRKVESLPFEKCISGGSTSGVYTDYNGRAVIGASACVDRLTFVIEMGRTEVLGAIAMLQQQIALVSILILIEVLIIMYFLTRIIVRPIRALSGTVKRFGKGEWDHRSDVSGGDEIGVLADSFNEMADTLQDLYENLEEKVKERTQDLQKFKLAVEQASDQITITDVKGTVLYANAVSEALTGYKLEELIGKNATYWRVKRSRTFFKKIRERMEKDKRSIAKELESKRKNGEIYIAELHISPIFDEKGKLRFFVILEQDITKAKEVDKAKSEFVSLASHQLRTPLSAINWYTELLLSGDAGKLSEEQRSYLSEIYTGGQRMVELVNALLNVSRMELGTFVIDPEPLVLSEIAESVLKELVPQTETKKLKINKAYDDDVPVFQGDKQLTRILFQNLLSNAVKYTPDNGTVTVSTSLRDTDRRGKKVKKQFIEIQIKDTGFGIPSNQQEKIFSKMFRAENAKKNVPEGNGLGLYLVKAIVEHVGGDIWFESEEGAGTTFYILLPIDGMKPHKKRSK